jgi:membrane protein DedA with SNARE-associated domain
VTGPLPAGALTWIGIAAATLVSEDLTIVGAGLAVGEGRLGLAAALSACFVGIFLGDVGLWALGRFGGRRILAWGPIARMPLTRLHALGHWLDGHPAVIFGSRFLPGTRMPLYIASGLVGTRPWRFIFWMFLAVAAWVPLVVILTSRFGPAIAGPLTAWLGSGLIASIVTVVVLVIALRTVGALATARGRARLGIRLARWRAWEFWPAWLFQLPIGLWILWLALRHRSLTLFSAANPGLEDGGIVGESKSAILARLPPEWVIPWFVVPAAGDDAEGRAAGALARIADAGWTWPVVMKPDVGERGVGVRWAHGPDDVARYLAREPGRVVIQQAHEGPYEAGVFYVRHPDAASGRLFSITDKRFPVVVGDGRSTLAALIEAHPRYRLQADVFLARHADVDRVPGAGEPVPLARAGNHCQGTEFRDGWHLHTAALEASVDAIARRVEGFHFGRFDLRYQSRDAFARGEGFAIVELNGVTSEATHVYDPDGSLVAAWRTLMAQWSIAYDIGAANRARGHAPVGVRRLTTLLRDYWRRRPAHRLSD